MAVALIQLWLSRHGLSAPVLSTVALVLLGCFWATKKPGGAWTPIEQVVDSLLLGVAGVGAGLPPAVLAAYYGGVYYRALTNGRHAAVRAALTYQAIYLVALVIADPHPDAAFAAQLFAALPGFVFAAVLTHTLNLALRRQAATQDEARETDSRFRNFVDTAYEGIVATDAVGRVTYVNARACAMLNRSADELVGSEWFALMTPDSAFAARTRFASRRLGHAELHELAFRNGVSEELWALCSSSPIFEGGSEFAGALVMMTDITQRKRADRELVHANQTLTTFIDTVPQAIVGLDRDYRVTLWNPAAEALLGWAAEEIVGAPLPTVPEHGRAEFLRLRHYEEQGGKVEGIEVPRLRKDGTTVDVYVRSAALHDANGAVVGSIGVYLDLTERKQLQQQLAQAQKMEAIGQLAGGVAHDFNNILTVIKANATFLSEGCPACGSALPEATEIDQAANRGAALTGQLLAFSRKQVIRPQLVSISTAVDRLATLLRRLVPENIELLRKYDRDVGHVLIDPGQLEQIVINLVVNARDAMPLGGRLTIDGARVTLDPGDSRRFGGTRIVAGDYLRLSVMDTGVGMNKETLARVFEPFFTTKPLGQGTGLGLSTVYGIVKQNNGYIDVRSEVGVGSSIDVYLPFRDASSAGEVRTQRGTTVASVRGSESILLVEDEEAIRRILERQLRASGYNVRSASNGIAALEAGKAEEGQIDLLITDVILPGISGAQLAYELTARQPGLRVLFMSGYTDDQIIREGVLPRGTELLEKPFGSDQLLMRVRILLDQSRKTDDGASPR